MQAVTEKKAILSHLSTQSLKHGGVNYNFRSFEDVEEFIKGICSKFKGHRPISEHWFGCCETSVGGFLTDLKNISEIYSKQAGILLRGSVIDIPKVELGNNSIQKAERIILWMAQYYLYQGYVVGALLYDIESAYEIIILINPVSFYDGGKYRSNQNDVLEEENECLRCAIYDAVNSNNIPSYDYSYLPVYPLSDYHKLSIVKMDSYSNR